MARANKKKVRVNPEGIAYIKATFNNTIITLADKQGNAIAWASAGALGFKGSRKNTPYAATQAADKVAQQGMSMGLSTIVVKVKGPGGGREAAIRGLQAAGLKVTKIMDINTICIR